MFLSLPSVQRPLILLLVMLLRMTRTALSNPNVKDLWILRHGQATHNPRAEAARAAGCSFEEFFELMRQDDSIDSPLTDLGQEQAAHVYKKYGHWLTEARLVVSSPLSRALQTANGALPPKDYPVPQRVCYEGFREVNGVLRNAQRRSVTDLRQRFPEWNFDALAAEHDDTWQEEILESFDDCKERGYQGLRWIYHERPEQRVVLVAHGGILRYTMSEHPQVVVKDGRRKNEEDRPVEARFDNCELRRYHVTWDEEKDSIVLTEVDFDHPWVEQDADQDAVTAAAEM